MLSSSWNESASTCCAFANNRRSAQSQITAATYITVGIIIFHGHNSTWTMQAYASSTPPAKSIAFMCLCRVPLAKLHHILGIMINMVPDQNIWLRVRKLDKAGSIKYSMMSYICWHVWRDRNSRLFRHGTFTLLDCLFKVCSNSLLGQDCLWMVSLVYHHRSHLFYHWSESLHRWNPWGVHRGGLTHSITSIKMSKR